MTSATRWHIPDCFIPVDSTGDFESHESICLLNDGPDATVTLVAYFADRPPNRSESVAIPGARCLHLRTNDPQAMGGLVIDRGVPYGLVIVSDRPLHLQYSRLDTTQPAYALMTIIPS